MRRTIGHHTMHLITQMTDRLVRKLFSWEMGLRNVPLAPREENLGFFFTLECHQRLDTEATSPAPR